MAKRAASRRAAGSVPAVAVVVSRYNGSITSKLLEGAAAAYRAEAGSETGLTVVDAPGSYELVALANAAARSGRFDGVVALGCVIKGETEHDRYIAQAVATGLAQVTVQTGVPVAFGVLTVNSPRQARDRAGGVMGNKGAEAMGAVLQTIAAIRGLEDGSRVPGRSATLPDKAKRSGASRRAAPRRRGRGGRS